MSVVVPSAALGVGAMRSCSGYCCCFGLAHVAQKLVRIPSDTGCSSALVFAVTEARCGMIIAGQRLRV